MKNRHSRAKHSPKMRKILAFFHALLATVLLTCGVAAFAATSILPSSGDAAEAQVAMDPFGRETPRSTVTNLLGVLASEDPGALDPYLDLPAGMDRAEVVPRLRAALDAGGTLATYQELANEPNGRLDDGLGPTREQVGTLAGGEIPILLTQSSGTDGPAIWRLSAETLQALPDIEPQAIPEEEAIVAGAPALDWVKLLGLLVAVFIATRLLAALVLLGLRQVLSRDGAVYRVLDAALPPLALVVTIVGFRLWSDAAPISIVARQVVLRYLGIAAWIVFLWFLFRLVDALARWLSLRMTRRARYQSASVIVFARRVIKAGLLVLGALGILDTLGFDVTAGVAALGIGGLVLALGAQKTVENLVGTVSVLADRPVQVGDVCKVGDVLGTIEDIGMRSTRIRTLERTVVTIPNSDFSSRQIENYTKRERFLFNETISLEYALDAAKLREGIGLIAEALAQNEHIAPEPRRATLRYFATDSLAIETFAYIMTADFDESLRIRNDLMLDIYERLEQAGIGFAFPTQTLYLRKDETGQG